jgi:hypothetical protein
MATLTLAAIWINLYGTGVAVSGVSPRDREEVYSTVGETRTYAGGRRRSITSGGEKATFKFGLRLISRTDINTLRSWAGQLVQVRDHKGRRFFGVFYDVTVSEYVSESVFDIMTTLNVLTQDEGI